MENRDNRKRMQFGSLEVRKLGPLIAFWRATDNTRHPSFPEPSGGGSITYNSSRARAQTRPSLSLWPLWELRAVIDRETVPSLHKCSTPEPVTPPPPRFRPTLSQHPLRCVLFPAVPRPAALGLWARVPGSALRAAQGWARDAAARPPARPPWRSWRAITSRPPWAAPSWCPACSSPPSAALCGSRTWTRSSTCRRRSGTARAASPCRRLVSAGPAPGTDPPNLCLSSPRQPSQT